MSESLTSFPKCPECGMIHPPSQPGMCPVANANKQQETEQSKAVSEFSNVLIKYLYNSPNWKQEIEAIKKCINLGG